MGGLKTWGDVSLRQTLHWKETSLKMSGYSEGISSFKGDFPENEASYGKISFHIFYQSTVHGFYRVISAKAVSMINP